MIALCLDPSLTSTGYALVRLPLGKDEGGVYRPNLLVVGGIFGRIRNDDAKESPQTRVVRLYERLWTILDQCLERPTLIAAEIPPNMFRASTMTSISLKIAAYTVVRLFAAHAKIPLLEVAPDQAKKYATGKSRAKKEDTLEAMSYLCLGNKDAKWPAGWSEDSIDALTVAVWLDSLRQLHATGATTPLSPYL